MYAHRFFGILLLILLTLSLCSCASVPKYEIVDLLGQKEGAVYSINNHGDVVGISSNKLFLYDSMTKNYIWGPDVSLDNPLVKISNQRDVLAGVTKDEQNNYSLCLWNPDQGISLIPFGKKNIQAKTFNNDNYALLWLWTGEWTWTGNYWAGNYVSTIWDIKDKKSIYSDPNNLLYVLNDSGDAVGCSREPEIFKNIFIVNINSDSVVRIPNMSGKRIIPRDINDKGQITGWIENENPEIQDESAFLWDKDKGLIRLGSIMDTHTILNGSLTKGYSVNNHEQIVGWSSGGTVSGPLVWPIQFRDAGRAFYWDKKSGMKDLNDMMTNKTDWYCLVEALDINDKGQIIGWGFKKGLDRKRPFLLNPIKDKNKVSGLLIDKRKN